MCGDVSSARVAEDAGVCVGGKGVGGCCYFHVAGRNLSLDCKLSPNLFSMLCLHLFFMLCLYLFCLTDDYRAFTLNLPHAHKQGKQGDGVEQKSGAREAEDERREEVRSVPGSEA